MSVQSFSLSTILAKLGDDWSLVKNRFDRYQSKGYVGNDEVWEREDENRWEALHNHPFPWVLEWVTVQTGISVDVLREASLKHFDDCTEVVEKLWCPNDKGQTKELWERLVKECPSVLLQAGLMPDEPTGGHPLPPRTDEDEGNGGDDNQEGETGQTKLPPSGNDAKQTIKGVSLQDAAAFIRPDDSARQKQKVKQWQASKLLPTPIGTESNHKQRNLYDVGQLISFLCKVEGAAIDKECNLKANFTRVKRLIRTDETG